MVDISNFAATKILDKMAEPVYSRIQMRARAAVISCKLGGKGEDRTRSYPELQEWSHIGKPSGDAEGKKEEAFTNVSMLSRRLSISVPSPI